MRKLLFYMGILMLMLPLMLSGCNAVAQVPLASPAVNATETPQPTPTMKLSPSVGPTQSAGNEIHEPSLSDGITLDFYQGGEQIRSTAVTDKAQKQTVLDAVFNYLIKSAALPAVDTNSLKDYIVIHFIYSGQANPLVTDLYVFDRDGMHCMQDNNFGRYSTISDEVYEPLLKLAKGQ